MRDKMLLEHVAESVQQTHQVQRNQAQLIVDISTNLSTITTINNYILEFYDAINTDAVSEQDRAVLVQARQTIRELCATNNDLMGQLGRTQTQSTSGRDQVWFGVCVLMCRFWRRWIPCVDIILQSCASLMMVPPRRGSRLRMIQSLLIRLIVVWTLMKRRMLMPIREPRHHVDISLQTQ
jgi:hypothetical protein